MVTAYLTKTCKIVTVTVAVILVFRTCIAEVGRVNGVSMQPTFRDTEMFFVNKTFLLFVAPDRGDIVHVIEPESGKMLIKRVVGLPGEQIILKDNRVNIIDTAGRTMTLPERYLPEGVITQPAPGQPNTFVLGDAEYFVLGDNRRESIDSRNYGPVPRRHIVGLVLNL